VSDFETSATTLYDAMPPKVYMYSGPVISAEEQAQMDAAEDLAERVRAACIPGVDSGVGLLCLVTRTSEDKSPDFPPIHGAFRCPANPDAYGKVDPGAFQWGIRVTSLNDLTALMEREDSDLILTRVALVDRSDAAWIVTISDSYH